MKNKRHPKTRSRYAPIRAHAIEAKDGHALELVVPVTITAAEDTDGKAKGPARFSMTAYTGGAMRLRGWQYPVVVDLEGIEGADKSLPILSDHDMSRQGIVGHTDKIDVTTGAGGKICAEGCISGAGSAAAEVRDSGKNGFPWQASIGASVIKNQFIPEGQTATANGREWHGPVNIARRSALGEISFVPRGADSQTSARVAAKEAAGASIMNFEQWLEAQGFVLAELSDKQKKSLKAAFDAEVKATAAAKDDVQASDTDTKDDEETAITAADVVKETRKGIVAEQKRVNALTKICAGNGELLAKAIEEAWSSEKAELEMLRAQRDRKPQNAPYINAGANIGQDQVVLAITASAARSAGVSEKVAFNGLTDQAKELAASSKMRGMGLHQIMFMIAAQAGIHHSHRVDDSFLKALLHHDQQQIVQAASGSGYSTMSLSGITENILNKAMLESYGAVASVVSDIAYETDTNDFKQFKRYRLTGSGTFQNVGPDGELKNMSLQDESYSNQLATKGAIITIGRDKLINDDMGALTQVPQVIGREAAVCREAAVFNAIFGNSGSFFASGNKNYLSGGSSVLGITGLTSAVQKFLEQKDANGNPIMIMPDRLLVPPALYAVAQNLFNGANLVVTQLGSTASKETAPNYNQHQGKYRPIQTPFLGAQQPASVGASGSDTAWYLLPNPAAGFAVVQIGYLRGQRVPIIERGESNFNTLGMSLRGFYDFGVALHDSRCGVLSAGA